MDTKAVSTGCGKKTTILWSRGMHIGDASSGISRTASSHNIGDVTAILALSAHASFTPGSMHSGVHRLAGDSFSNVQGRALTQNGVFTSLTRH